MTDAHHHHPGPRTINAIHNAAQVALAIAENVTKITETTPGGFDIAMADGVSVAGFRIAAMLRDAGSDVAALQLLLERQENVLAELREEGCRQSQYITRIEEKNSALTQSVITLTRARDDYRDELACRTLTERARPLTAAGAT